MPESQPNTEIQGGLSSAVTIVTELCLKASNMLDTQNRELDNSWKQTAQKFPTFSNKIIELGKALKNADEKKKKHSDIDLAKYSIFFFQNVPDDQVKKIFSDVWCSRINVPESPHDLMKTGYSEAQNIIKEMNEGGNLCRLKTNNFTREEVIGRILKGELKLTHQPKQKA